MHEVLGKTELLPAGLRAGQGGGRPAEAAHHGPHGGHGGDRHGPDGGHGGPHHGFALLGAMVGAEVPTVPASVFIL